MDDKSAFVSVWRRCKGDFMLKHMGVLELITFKTRSYLLPVGPRAGQSQAARSCSKVKVTD